MMYAYISQTVDPDAGNVFTTQILYSHQLLPRERVLKALAENRAPLPPGWIQLTNEILRYSRSEEYLVIGSVKLEGAEWQAYCARKSLGGFPKLEDAMACVERWAIVGRSTPAQIRKGLQVVMDRSVACTNAPFICGGLRETWCNVCILRDAIESLKGADDMAGDIDEATVYAEAQQV